MKSFFHPGMAALIAYADGALASGRARRVELHIAKCPECRGELDEIRRERTLFAHRLRAASMSMNSDAVALSRAALMAAIEALPDGQPETGDRLRSRIGEELQVYFGEEAASSVLRSTPPAELMARAERLLSLFLGRRSAASITAGIAAGAASAEARPAC